MKIRKIWGKDESKKKRKCNGERREKWAKEKKRNQNFGR